MDKIHNISIGGFAFVIEDEAYLNLKTYLQKIKISLEKSGDVDEIIADIEFRIVELLKERMKTREVVNGGDVMHIIGVMGQPEDYLSEEIESEETYTSSHSGQAKTIKKLYRDPDDKKLGGVLSGLGHYLGIDAVWLRVLLLVLPFMDIFLVGISTGSIIIAYLILWIAIPEAKTASQKLEMRGEPVNFDSIKDFFVNSPSDENGEAPRAAKSSSVLGNLMNLFVKLITFVAVFVLVLVAFSLVISLVAVIFGLGVAGFGAGIAGLSLSDYLPYLVENNWEIWIFYISFALVMLMPAIGLLLLVMRLISKRYQAPRWAGISVVAMFFVGFLGLTILTISVLRNFQRTSTRTEVLTIPKNDSILRVDWKEKDFEDLIKEERDVFYYENPRDLRVAAAKESENYLKLNYITKGENTEQAEENQKYTVFPFEIDSSYLSVNNIVGVKKEGKWRNQVIKPTLYLAENQKVTFLEKQYVRNDNGNDFYVKPNIIYIFAKGELHCLHCEEKNNDPEATDGAEEKLNMEIGENGIDLEIKDEDENVKVKIDDNGIKINN